MTSMETQAPKPVSRRPRPFPAWLAILSDSAAWFIAILTLTVTRFLLSDTPVDVNWTEALSNVALMSLLTIVLAAIGGLASGLYRHRYIAGSLDELRALTLVTFVTWFILAIVVLATVAIPRSGVLAVFPTVLLPTGGVRLAFRQMVENRVGPAGSAVPVLLYGARELGHSVVRRMRVDPLSEFRPVGFVDDDPRKKSLVLSGLKVLGNGKALARIAEQSGAGAVVI